MRTMVALSIILLLCISEVVGQEPLALLINGRVAHVDAKLENCEVITYKGNEEIHRQTTGRNGRFGMLLGLGEEYSVEFRKEGFLPKRVVVDTRADLSKDIVDIAPLEMEMSMLPAGKYAGANTDDLDFPFAIVRYDRSMKAFVQDQQYTADMMRTNGALLLMSGRSGKH